MAQPLTVVERTSLLHAPPEAVWARVTTWEGVNDELRPLFRLTRPPGLRDVDLDEVVGRPLGKAWLLLAGVVPVQYDDMTIAELEPGRRFLERSSMALLSPWIHERTVAADGDGTLLTDRLELGLRRPLGNVMELASVAGTVVSAVFAHRHRRLRRRFGAA